MLYVIYNKETGKVLETPARSAGMFVRNYKSAAAAKAGLTRIAKKHVRKVEVHNIYNELNGADMNFRELREAMVEAGCTEREAYNASRKPEDFDREDYVVADVETYREEFPVKMVERINMMSGKPYMEAENTPGYLSPASEAYWSM